MKTSITPVLLAAGMLLPLLLTAQLNNVPRWQFTAGGGVFIYQGDLTPEKAGAYKTMRPLLYVAAARLVSPSFSLRLGLSGGSLRGDDSKYDEPAYRQQRNFNFHSGVTELTGTAEWNILARNYTGRGWAPYVFAGAGLSHLRIRRDWSRFNADYFSSEGQLLPGLQEDQAHRLPSLLPVVPVGAGARYYFSDRLGLQAETSYRLMSSDYLDGFSRSVNPDKKDNYYSHTISIVYRIGKKDMLKCPPLPY
ncbi:MAG TPA: DUF6089 family protein [Chitinophagaceae bacterium]|nr:DUF6089 family protein [Chitinophagaceae bacterium]